MRNLCFGGSFNPVHDAHLRCAAAAAAQAGFDRIVLIPSGQPPHKQGDTTIAPAADRLTMCQLAAQTDPQFQVDPIETRRAGPSYTIDTARQLKQDRGWTEVAWLIGADMARYLPHWHDVDALLAEVHFVLMARPGWSFDWETLPQKYQHLQHQVVATPLIDISSSEIRRRVAAGEPIDHLVPPAVADYIRDRKLYRPNP
jgi:nicotinate-nucleotide adenylyltransferase